GRDGNLVALGEQEIQRQMMTLDAPAPGAVRPGFAENRHEIKLRIAGRTFALLEVAKDLFQAHDGRGLQIAAMTQSGAQERVSEVLLLGSHFLNGKSLALAGYEMPRSEEHTSELQSRFDLVCRL